MYRILLVISLLFISSCTSALKRDIAVPGTYNRVFIASVDAALESGFGVTEADRDVGLILAEDTSPKNDGIFDLRIDLEERGYDVLITVAIYADNEEDRVRTFSKFVNNLKKTNKKARIITGG